MRLIDADTLRAARYHALPYTHIHALGVDVESYERGWNDALDGVAESAPTVDAEPVVRCKDCKYCKTWYFDKNGDSPSASCKFWNGVAVYKNGFCSNGERRIDDETDKCG